jgi:hypothetical protein
MPRDPSRRPLTDIVDDATFDLLQALTSSLEALDAYREFATSSPDSVFTMLIEDERRQASALLAALRQRLRD